MRFIAEISVIVISAIWYYTARALLSLLTWTSNMLINVIDKKLYTLLLWAEKIK